MLKMRLQRVGRKHEPSFRLVLTDSKNSTKSGRIFETLGSYDPRKITETFKTDRIKHWITQGISLTPSVNNLLIKHKIINGKKIHVSTVPAPVVVEAPVEAAPVVAPEPVVEEVAPAQAQAEAAPEPTPEPVQAEPEPTPEPEKPADEPVA